MRTTRKFATEIVDDRNQPETEDNLGYTLEELEEGIDLPVVEPHRGPLSESLVRQLEADDYVTIIGEDQNHAERVIRLSMSRCNRFINAEVLVLGHPTGNFFNIAYKNTKDIWYYNKDMRQKLEALSNPNHWLAKLHCYLRV